MTKKTTNLLGIIIAVLAGTFFYLKLCSSCGETLLVDPVKEVVEVPKSPQPTLYPYEFSYGDYGYHAIDNYNFMESSPSIIMPLSKKVPNGIASLSAFLSENKDKVINITGFFKKDEINSSSFSNLGLARANMVKNHMVENGILSAQINISRELSDEMVLYNNVYSGPIKHNIGTRTEHQDNNNSLVSLNR